MRQRRNFAGRDGDTVLGQKFLRIRRVCFVLVLSVLEHRRSIQSKTNGVQSSVNLRSKGLKSLGTEDDSDR